MQPVLRNLRSEIKMKENEKSWFLTIFCYWVLHNLIYFKKSSLQTFCILVLNIIYLHASSFLLLSSLSLSLISTFLLQPARRHAYAGENVFYPVERELVFDIVSRSFFEDAQFENCEIIFIENIL